MPVALDRAYRVDPDVAVRAERFGALCYHYRNRRLTFLTSADMVAVMHLLGDQPSLADALRTAGVVEQRWPAFVRALSSLESSEMIHER